MRSTPLMLLALMSGFAAQVPAPTPLEHPAHLHRDFPDRRRRVRTSGPRWLGTSAVPCTHPGCGAGVGDPCRRSTPGAHAYHKVREDAAAAARSSQ